MACPNVRVFLSNFGQLDLANQAAQVVEFHPAPFTVRKQPFVRTERHSLHPNGPSMTKPTNHANHRSSQLRY